MLEFIDMYSNSYSSAEERLITMDHVRIGIKNTAGYLPCGGRYLVSLDLAIGASMGITSS